MRNKEGEIEKTLKALANGRRLAIVAFLKSQKQASVGEIAEEIRLSFKSTSRHLSVLRGAEILEREQQSLQMFYTIARELPTPARQVITLL